MKKIFTLIATACMALTANAQNLIVFDNDATYIDEQSFTKGDVTLTLSKDIKNATKWNKKVYAVKEGENLAPFNQAINSENDVLYIYQEEIILRMVKITQVQDIQKKMQIFQNLEHTIK